MRIFPLDILAGILIIVGLTQILLSVFVRRRIPGSRFLSILILGCFLVLDSILFIYLSLSEMDFYRNITAVGWIIWLALSLIITAIRRCPSS